MTTFSTLEGFGSGTTGGAGGAIIYVTNLNDSGAGSLREALLTSGPRIILFKIGGTITLNTRIVVVDGNFSLLGQSAPSNSGGITIKNGGGLTSGPLWLRASNIIIRHIRFRPGPSTTQQFVDGITVGTSSGAINNIVFDHCSFSWSIDELIGFAGIVTDVSIQWCLLGEALNNNNHPENRDHSMGILMQHPSARISIHHCLFSSCRDRTPRAKINGILDFRNNWIYNIEVESNGWGSSHYSDEYGDTHVNIVKNFIKLGPDSATTGHYQSSGQPAGNDVSIYINGNVLASITEGPTAVILQRETSNNVAIPFAAPILLSETDALTARDDILACVGCRVPTQDSVDQRILAETANGTGTWLDSQATVGGWPTLSSGTTYTDSNNDGIPDGVVASDVISYMDTLGATCNQVISTLSANWTQDSTGGLGPQTVTFTDTSVPSVGETLTNWTWEYSTDGTTWTQFSIQQNPVYTFICEGCYEIRLTIRDSGNNTATKTVP